MSYSIGSIPSQLDRAYKYMRLEWNAEFSMLTTRIGVKPIQCYSLAAMAELHQVFSDISANPGLVKHFVMASDVPASSAASRASSVAPVAIITGQASSNPGCAPRAPARSAGRVVDAR